MANLKYFNPSTSQWENIIAGQKGESGIVAQDTEPTDTSVLWLDTDEDGVGIPLGGTTGQALVKVNNSDFNTTWMTPNGSGNAIINGALDIWQRGTSLASSSGPRFLSDRLRNDSGASTYTVSQQAFNSAELNVIGFGDASFYHRTTVTSVAGASNYALVDYAIEDVRTFAGQTVTFSFWAKADSNKNIAFEFNQIFGGGVVTRVNPGRQAITTSWTRYTKTIDIPSTAGKTINLGSNLVVRIWLEAGSTFASRSDSIGQQNITFDTWGWQLEAGAVATPFRRNANSLQGELAACQRYYKRVTSAGGTQFFANGFAFNDITGDIFFDFPIAMRVTPTFSYNLNGNTFLFRFAGGSTPVTVITPRELAVHENSVSLTFTGTGMISGSGYIRSNIAGQWVEFSAEL